MSRLLQQKIDASLSIEVWHFEESEAFFWSELPLGAEDAAAIRSLRLERRRLERLACRMALLDLLRALSLTPDLRNLSYDEHGKPHLGDLHISFSHSGNYAAVAISTECPVGIDIEVLGERVGRVYQRFLNKKELSECDTADLSQLHYYWGAKEAIYKATRVDDPFEGITIRPSESLGIVHKKTGTEKYRLYLEYLEDFCLVAARPL